MATEIKAALPRLETKELAGWHSPMNQTTIQTTERGVRPMSLKEVMMPETTALRAATLRERNQL